ncbi:Ketosamine-3-kinase like protein [Verticillium longisporum]|nr:Ketosamine-3-kinase like protein [Verticillium longisporum]
MGPEPEPSAERARDDPPVEAVRRIDAAILQKLTADTTVNSVSVKAAQGPNQDILGLMEPFFSNVIPRLLRPLETDGRSITPSLIHGDLWHGNVATDADTQEPVIFDAASSHAHNEYELGVWRQPWNELGAAHRARYHEFSPPSSPVEDCDDRNALYVTRVHVLDSILYRDDDEYRKMLIASMRRLVEKFPGGYEEWKGQQV